MSSVSFQLSYLQSKVEKIKDSKPLLLQHFFIHKAHTVKFIMSVIEALQNFFVPCNRCWCLRHIHVPVGNRYMDLLKEVAAFWTLHPQCCPLMLSLAKLKVQHYCPHCTQHTNKRSGHNVLLWCGQSLMQDSEASSPSGLSPFRSTFKDSGWTL